VAGHRGLVGQAILRKLQHEGYSNCITRTRQQVDLCDQTAVGQFFETEKPEIVFLAAAKVGGIYANSAYPADFIRDNLRIQTNVIDAAYRCGSKKMMILGSSCIYPKFSPQPIKEESLLSGLLEPTNESYAVAKIAGIYMAQAYRRQHGFNTIALMPTNLYGPGDNFNLENSHVMPALIRKCHEAKLARAESFTIWGSGTPRREFLHVDDLASAAIMLMLEYNSHEIVNVGTGTDISINDLAELVRSIVGFKGKISSDASKPDGTPRKLLDVARLRALGWAPKISLAQGIEHTYKWYLANHKEH
jgi:GDP-L-fucose synthase